MSATQPKIKQSPSSSRVVPTPVMKVTFYDRLSAGMIAIALALAATVCSVFVWWWSIQPPPAIEFLVPMEMIESGRGGDPDGPPGESLRVESSDPPADNASAVEEFVDETLVSTVVDGLGASAVLVELSERGTRQAPQFFGESTPLAGRPGSSDGTGNRRGLGFGPGPGGGGIANEHRWLIRFADETSLAEYCRQLDFFGIELGAWLPDGQLVYLSNVSQASPAKRVTQTGKDEQRLYMTWQGGARKEADVKIFQKAGVDASQAVLFHFYPKKTEQMLLSQEFQFAKRRALEIRRTYFVVSKQEAGYAFTVTRQTYFR